MKSTLQIAKQLTLNELSSLPITKEATIDEDYLDSNQHMNVSWYLHLFHRSTGGMHRWLEIDWRQRNTDAAGVFILEGHVRYLSEVLVGQHVTIRTRLIAVETKRIQFLHFMFNDDAQKVAATYEEVQANVDLKTRRMAPYPDPIAEKLRAALAEHQALTWDPPVCGMMQP